MGVGKLVQITSVWWTRRVPRAQPCCIRFCLSQYYHYWPIIQINPSSPSQSHFAIEGQCFRSSVKIFTQSTLAGGSLKNFVTRPWTCFWQPCL